MKKILLMLTAAALCVLSMGVLIGCGFFGGKTKVSDYESFMAAAGKNAKIELAADIDFGGAEVAPIALKTLNGNGHTIKNVKVLPGLNIRNAVNTGHYISLLGEYTKEVKDVIFDNITIEDDGYAKYASFVAAACMEMDNVVVKNSSMSIQDGFYVGGLTCKLKYMSLLADFQDDGKAPTNSGIEDCTITTTYDTLRLGGICTTGSGSGLYAKNLTINAGMAELVGGLLADGSFENCYIESCDIYAKTYSSDGLSPLYVGGLGGKVGSAKNCYVNDTKIKAEAPYYSENFIGIQSVATVYVGGIGADSGTFNTEYCYASDNEFSVLSTGSAYVGGIFGRVVSGTGGSTVTQCYANDNKIEAKGYVTGYRADLYSAQTRALGGIIGYAKNLKLTSSYAYGNTVLERSFDGMQSINNADYFGETYMCAGGLIGYKADGTTASDCASTSKKLYSLNCKAEAYGSHHPASTPETVYIELTEEEWLDGTTLLEKLKLDAERWIAEAGKLPTLKKD